MIAFSIVLMSRSRPDMFEDLCKSINNTCLLDYEIHVGLDSDDPNLSDYISIVNKIKKYKTHIENRNSNLHVRLNSMLESISGKYIFGLNDDCILTTKHWDKQAYDILNDFGDIVYGRTKDNSIDRVDSSYAAFPIVSTNAAKRLGFIMDDTYGNHGSDVITYRIYNEANKVVDLSFLKIDHRLHNSLDALAMRQKDKTSIDMINRTMSAGFNVNTLFSMPVQDKVKKLL